MSYDLNFWREQRGASLDPQTVYKRLSAGEHVDGLEDLPIAEILERLKETFGKGWTQLDEFTWEAPMKSFQVFTTPQLFRVDCGGMTGEEMNRFIEIGLEFDCPLFDPQVGVRFLGG